MRSARLAFVLIASLVLAAPSAAHLSPQPATQLAEAEKLRPLPGLSEKIDHALWCATMAGQLADSARARGEWRMVAALSPLAMALSRQVSTFFVALQFGEPDIESYIDLYAIEVAAVLDGSLPQRYAPGQCRSLVLPQVVA